LSKADANGNVTYDVINMDTGGSYTQKSITMPATEAATVNLYGACSYPAYAVAPTGATEILGGAVNPVDLSMQADAIALATSFGLTAAAVTDGGAGNVNYPADEQRRVWVIAYKGAGLCAGSLLAEMYVNGVGAPGQWNLSGTAPVWVPTSVSLPPQNPAWDVPTRPMLANEAIATSLFGCMVYRKDMPSVYNPAVTPAAPAAGSTTTSGSSTTQATSAHATFLQNLEAALLAALKAALAQALVQQ
jgi:hypothetical protein